MAILNNAYVVNGHFDFNPSKMSEAVGLRVYAKLKKPRGLFFRNPSLMGIYAENLQAGEIEYVFGVDTDQVPFIGRVRTMLIVQDMVDGKWKIVEHPEAQTDYSILSKDIVASFGKRIRPTYDKSMWTDVSTLENYRENFYTWLDQRKTAYYEGFRANSGSDPRTWRTFIDADSQTYFTALKLALAIEYWWFMRLGYVKAGVLPAAYMHTTLALSAFVDGKGNMTCGTAPESGPYQGLESFKNLISLNLKQLFDKARDIAVTNYNLRISEVDPAVEIVDPTDRNAYNGFYEGTTSSTGAGTSGSFGGTTYLTWTYNATDDAKGLTVDPSTHLTVAGRDTSANRMQYWQEYFLFSENEDDNDSPFRSYLSSESRYIGGIEKPDSFYFSNVMQFERPYDNSPQQIESVVENRAELTYFKIRMRMNNPGCRYYVGVMLVHKQDIVASQKATELASDPVFAALPQDQKDAIINKRSNLNSDIIFTPMISRPDTPDWLDEETGLLSVHGVEDADSINKFLSTNDKLEAEGVNWAISLDPNVSKFNLLWGIPSDVKNNLTYYLKQDIKTTKFYMQAPFAGPDSEIALIQLVPGEDSLASALATHVGNKYRVVDSDQGGTTGLAPTTDKNTCTVSDAKIILTNDFTYTSVTTMEKRNSQVRKFYLFYAEKTENIFRLQNEPIEITNRDWADAKTVGKFDPTTRFVIRRFNNDTNSNAYTTSYSRTFTVYDKTSGVELKSNTYYSVNGTDIYVKGGSPAGDSLVTDSTILANLVVKTETDVEDTTDFKWDGSQFVITSTNAPTTPTQQRGTLVYAISGTVSDPDHNDPELTISKLTATTYKVTQKTGVSSTYLDTFMITDEIRISDDTFETALQRAYCIASIIPTHAQELNYYVYTNRNGASGTV